jgi:hypothetical protein
MLSQQENAMPTIKTDPELIRRLEASAKRQLSKDEVRAQRVSFVYGNMPQESSMSRNQVEAIIAKIEGEAA